jgi:hypothetical protein
VHIVEVERKEQALGEPAKKENWIVAVLNSSVVAASVTVLLGTLFSGILLERFKQNTLEIDRARQKQETVTNNQLNVLEKLDVILVNYFLVVSL